MKKIFSKLHFSYLMIVLNVLMIGIFCGCSKNESNYISHINDTISLSLYNVHLGDSLSVVRTKFRNLTFVPLDSLSSYVPIENKMKVVYEDLGISVYTTDTIFIANHVGWQHMKNGSREDFPLKTTKHRAQLIFFIKDQKVLQGEILIFSNIIDDIKGVELSSGDFIKSIQKLYEEKYNNPDSILVYNRVSRESATYSIDTDSIAKVQINEDIEATDNKFAINNSLASRWSWKNANIIAEWDFQPYKDGKIWFWVSCFMVRIIYTDLNAVELESKRRLKLIRLREQDSIRRIKKIENDNMELLKKQVI